MCPICHLSGFTFTGVPKISDKAFKLIRKDYGVVKCNRCGVFYINPAIDFSGDDWKYLYDDEYFPEMSRWYVKNRVKDMIQRFDNIERFANNKKINFLDIGCGEGYCLIESDRRDWNTYGLDISDNRITYARNTNISFVNSGLTDAKLQSDFFDAVYMDSVLEHVTNPLEYLNEINRIMKKGGILYIGVPNEDSLLNDVKGVIFKITGSNISPKIKPFVSPYHVIGFNRLSLNNALEKTNFRVRRMRNFACRFEFLRSKPFSKNFFHSLLLLPVYLLAVPLRREVYLEVYAEKK